MIKYVLFLCLYHPMLMGAPLVHEQIVQQVIVHFWSRRVPTPLCFLTHSFATVKENRAGCECQCPCQMSRTEGRVG